MIKFIDYQLVSYNEMKHLKHTQNYRVRAVFYISYFSNHDRSKMKHACIDIFRSEKSRCIQKILPIPYSLS